MQNSWGDKDIAKNKDKNLEPSLYNISRCNGRRVSTLLRPDKRKEGSREERKINMRHEERGRNDR